MPEILGAELQVDRLISADPANGVTAVLNSDGTVSNLVSRSQATGDVTWSAPANSSGTNTRRHLFDREIVSTAAITGTAITGTTGTFSSTLAAMDNVSTGTGVLGRGAVSMGVDTVGISDNARLLNYAATANGNGTKLGFEMLRANASAAVFGNIRGEVTDNTTATFAGKVVIGAAIGGSVLDMLTVTGTGISTPGTALIGTTVTGTIPAGAVATAFEKGLWGVHSNNINTYHVASLGDGGGGLVACLFGDSTRSMYLFFDDPIGPLSLKKVTVGVSDSGGSGYRVLRVPN